MRFLPLLAAVLALVFACGDDDTRRDVSVDAEVDAEVDAGIADTHLDLNPPRVGVDALWQLRCPAAPLAGTPACTTHGDAVNLLSFNGPDVLAECNVVPEADGFVASLRIAQGEHDLAINDLRVTAEGVVSTGQVRIVDGDYTYVGQASGAAPTEATPCQLISFRFDERSEGPAMSFSLLCRNIQDENMRQIQRDLVFPDDALQGSAISVFNCPGLL